MSSTWRPQTLQRGQNACNGSCRCPAAGNSDYRAHVLLEDLETPRGLSRRKTQCSPHWRCGVRYLLQHLGVFKFLYLSPDAYLHSCGFLFCTGHPPTHKVLYESCRGQRPTGAERQDGLLIGTQYISKTELSESVSKGFSERKAVCIGPADILVAKGLGCHKDNSRSNSGPTCLKNRPGACVPQIPAGQTNSEGTEAGTCP